MRCTSFAFVFFPPSFRICTFWINHCKCSNSIIVIVKHLSQYYLMQIKLIIITLEPLEIIINILCMRLATAVTMILIVKSLKLNYRLSYVINNQSFVG